MSQGQQPFGPDRERTSGQARGRTHWRTHWRTTPHIAEAELGLYGAGDLSWWRRPVLRFHLAQCQRCRERVQAYQSDRQQVRNVAAQMPPHLNWESLAREMTANIHVGLAAGECVAPRRERRGLSTTWRVVAASVGLSVLLSTAWWINTPARETESLGRAMKAMTTRAFSTGGILGGNRRYAAWEDSPALVGVSAAGIELRENGSMLGVSQGEERPVAVSLSVKGSARARYVDADTGQVTITGVYAQ
jgi:hypothetical protein